jgi:hypothetical protein
MIPHTVADQPQDNALLSLPLGSLSILALLFIAGLFIPNCDYLAFRYGQGLPPGAYGSSLMDLHYSLYRYVAAFSDLLLSWMGYSYFNLLGFWVLFLVASLWFCIHECIAFIRLPQTYIFLWILGIGIHGFWAEFSQFGESYLTYALALSATGFALHASRLDSLKSFTKTLLVIFWSSIILMTYQAMFLILIFCIILALIRDSVIENSAYQPSILKDFLPILMGICISCALFLLITRIMPYIFPIAIDRSYSFAWRDVIKNILAYFLTLPALFLPRADDIPYYFSFPLHERLLYGLTYGVMFFYLYFRRAVIPFIALILGIFLSAGPMNIFIPGYFPTLRSMTPTAFFQIGLVFILAVLGFEWLKRHKPDWNHEKIFLTLGLMIVCLSGANQLSILGERWRQYRQDIAIANGIKFDLRANRRLYPGSKIAFLSEKRSHIAQLNRMLIMDFPISAFSFSASPSEVPFLKSVSGIDILHITAGHLLSYTKAPTILHLYEALCSQAYPPWEFRSVEDITLICLPSVSKANNISPQSHDFSDAAKSVGDASSQKPADRQRAHVQDNKAFHDQQVAHRTEIASLWNHPEAIDTSAH